MSKETYKHIRDNLHTLKLDLENGKILNRSVKSLNSKGYLEVRLKGKIVKQHQVFAIAMWGEKCIGMVVNHINEIKSDNRAANLELLTWRENLIVSTKTNKSGKPFGSGKPKSPIKAINIDTGEEIVFESQCEAAIQLGLNRAGIHHVLNRKQKHAGGYRFERVS
ncbi:HNH endonuclease [Bacillus litorisediminis]|uniref:HNH endonuclease n=1 Tax=Bacillus litorisediminis TaxID=2922713 RepID=UPI001FACB73A|nr:HNH endonuclease [Bacillus litorisediminis]